MGVPWWIGGCWNKSKSDNVKTVEEGVVSRQDLTPSSVIMTAARNSFSIRMIIYDILQIYRVYCTEQSVYTRKIHFIKTKRLHKYIKPYYLSKMKDLLQNTIFRQLSHVLFSRVSCPPSLWSISDVRTEKSDNVGWPSPPPLLAPQ